MKKIKIFATGGTISAYHPDRTDLRNYTSGHYSGEALLEALPELIDMADVEIEQLSNISSTLISGEHWLLLKKKLEKALIDDEFDGAVITHGTNTLEETAYFLHLTIPIDKPIVLTGAQRPFSALSTDAHLNLLNAVRTAAAEESKGKGVLVMLNDEIQSAREASKLNTYRLETFQSTDLGFLGYVDPDRTVQYYRAPLRKHTRNSEFAYVEFSSLPRVEIIYSYAGADGRLIRWLAEEGQTDGIVMAGTGAGRCSKAEEEALLEARAKGIHVVLGSWVGNGRVAALEIYDRLDAVTADNLLPQKARILLMCSLVKYNEAKEIQRIFDEY